MSFNLLRKNSNLLYIPNSTIPCITFSDLLFRHYHFKPKIKNNEKAYDFTGRFISRYVLFTCL